MKKIYILSTVIISLLCIISGCNPSGLDKVGGKFAFISTRDSTVENPQWYLYLLKQNKLHKISNRLSSPKWSRDGKTIICTSLDGIVTIDEQGNQINCIETEYKPISLDISSNGNIIVYSAKEKINDRESRFYIYVYDKITQKHSKIYTSEINFFISNISLSPGNNKILFKESEIPGRKPTINLINKNGNNFTCIWEYATNPSWFPDGRNILLATNNSEKGGFINDKFGAYLKVDIKSLKSQMIREPNSMESNIKLSRDGRYIYYSKNYIKKGEYIAISPINESDTEIAITKPTSIEYQGRFLEYSQDFNADWYQGE